MTTWSNITKPNTTWFDGVNYLISQALDFLLTEDNKFIITNPSEGAVPNTIWINKSK